MGQGCKHSFANYPLHFFYQKNTTIKTYYGVQNVPRKKTDPRNLGTVIFPITQLFKIIYSIFLVHFFVTVSFRPEVGINYWIFVHSQ